MSKKNSSYRDLTTRRKRDDTTIGHADVDGTIDGAEGEGT